MTFFMFWLWRWVQLSPINMAKTQQTTGPMIVGALAMAMTSNIRPPATD